ncbi:AcrIIA2 family anti-CRISPR protein [Listeria monocytogenes]|nr:AcrIIA2 family anti-CRISPR protein [Listeria monocytogenes]EKP7338690.1 AcrIIA2 family anti-CRISPR protein [Listeria monocytogenes]NVS04989.1 AcrIIA2 family anti-CRISPR protein [Listeria monocytogenes]
MVRMQCEIKFDNAINEFEELIGKDVWKTPQIERSDISCSDYVVITSTAKYAPAICISDIEGYEDRSFLDEKVLASTVLEMIDGEDYYIHVVEVTSLDDDEKVTMLASNRQIYECHKQEEQKTVILKMELS